jgi:hypothetical protein
MAQQYLVSSPTLHDNGWPTTPDNALTDGGGNASTTIPDDELILYGFDFTGLPDPCIITGIAVRIDGSFTETSPPGTQLMKLGAELSWDSGSSWTSQVDSPILKETEQTFVIGDATDDWGKSPDWTRDEIVGTSFRVRIDARVKNILDVPTWNLDWVQVTVYYDDTSTLTLSGVDAFEFSDSGFTDPAHVIGKDVLGLEDEAALPDTPQYLLAGTAMSEMQGGGTPFEQALNRKLRAESVCASIILEFGSPATTERFDICDNIGAARFRAGNSGIVSLGGIDTHAEFGNPAHTPTCTLTIENKQYTRQQGAIKDIAWIGDRLREMGVFRSVVTVSGLVNASEEDNALLQLQLLFQGAIETYSVGDVIELYCVQRDRLNESIPNIEINDDLFVYGDSEGTIPEQSRGAVIPVGLGRFNIDAVKTDFSSLHPFSKMPLWERSFFPAYLGIKHPMMPAVLSSDYYAKRDGDTNRTTGSGKNAIFLQGDLRPPYAMSVKTSQSVLYNLRLVGYSPTNTYPDHGQPEFNDRFIPTCIFAWNDELDQGVPFAINTSNDVESENPVEQAGDLRLLTSGAISDGLAEWCAAAFINRQPPSSYGSTITVWDRPFRMIALIPETKLTTPATTDGLVFNTSVVSTENFDKIFDKNKLLLDEDANVWIANSVHRASVELPESGPAGGSIVAVGCSWLKDDADGETGNEKMACRWTPLPPIMKPGINFALQPGWFTDLESNFGLQWDGAASTWYTTMIGPRYHPKWSGDDRDNPVFFWRWESPWNFVAKTDRTSSYFGRHFSPHVMLHRASGGTKFNMKIRAIWMDVFYSDKEEPSGNDYHFKLYAIRMRNQNRSIFVDGRIRGSLSWFARPENWPENQEDAPIPTQRVFVTGIGPQDTPVTPTYTGVQAAVIENPADIWGFLTHKYLNQFNTRATGSTFGSFVTARTLSNAAIAAQHSPDIPWAMTVVFDETAELRDVIARIGRQSKMAFTRQWVDGQLLWRAFYDDPEPQTNDTARLFQADGYGFKWDDIYEGSFLPRTTGTNDAYTDFKLQFGLHQPSGEYVGGIYCNTWGSNLLTENAAHVARCVEAKRALSQTRLFEVDCPDLWRQEIADEILKWHVALRTQWRVVLEFDAYMWPGLLLAPGHVIRMDDEIGDRKKWMGRPGDSANWSSHYFNVVDVSIGKGAREPFKVHVTAVEVYNAP